MFLGVEVKIGKGDMFDIVAHKLHPLILDELEVGTDDKHRRWGYHEAGNRCLGFTSINFTTTASNNSNDNSNN